MTDLLHWRTFVKTDRLALARFVCTDPENKIWDGRTKTHPRPWEYTVQSSIRMHRPRPARHEHMFLGLDEKGIGAVAAWTFYDDPSEALLQLIAVAIRFRGRGRGWAKEAVTVAMSTIIDQSRAGGASDLAVHARIDHRNLASKRLFGEAGFMYESDCTHDLETWGCYTAL